MRQRGASAPWRDLFREIERLETEVETLSGGRALDRAEGTRYLGRLLAAALARFDPRPGAAAIDYGIPRIGGFNPDFRFGHAEIDPRGTYLLRGAMNGAARLALSTHASALASAQPIGHLSSETIRCDSGGRFEILVGADAPSETLPGAAAEAATGTRPPGPAAAASRPPSGPANRLATEGRATALLVRQLLLRRSDRPADLVLERLDPPAGPTEPAPLTPERQRDALGGVLLFVAGAAGRFFRWTRLLSRISNAIEHVPEEIADEVKADPDTFYALGYFDLAPGERLEVRLSPPPCAYWGLHTTNHWLEPIEHTTLVCHRNCATAEPDPDGSFTLSIAPVDDPRPNSLHTLGHRNGAIFYRVIGAGGAEVALPECAVRRLDEPAPPLRR